jgi:hypothetical protein
MRGWDEDTPGLWLAESSVYLERLRKPSGNLFQQEFRF